MLCLVTPTLYTLHTAQISSSTVPCPALPGLCLLVATQHYPRCSIPTMHYHHHHHLPAMPAAGAAPGVLHQVFPSPALLWYILVHSVLYIRTQGNEGSYSQPASHQPTRGSASMDTHAYLHPSSIIPIHACLIFSESSLPY